MTGVRDAVAASAGQEEESHGTKSMNDGNRGRDKASPFDQARWHALRASLVDARGLPAAWRAVLLDEAADLLDAVTRHQAALRPSGILTRRGLTRRGLGGKSWIQPENWEFEMHTTTEFMFDLEMNNAPSLEEVCRRFGNDANRALVLIRFRTLRAWCAGEDAAKWLNAGSRTLRDIWRRGKQLRTERSLGVRCRRLLFDRRQNHQPEVAIPARLI